MSSHRKLRSEFPELIKVSRRAGMAIGDFAMIQEGDRIAVAVSGGKDSISLLHILRHRQSVAPIKFDFIAVHVDFGVRSFDSERLVEYLTREGFAFHIEKVEPDGEQDWAEAGCYWFSRTRRKVLFELADARGFNKIALGHHLDDIVETILLNQFFRGEIAAMKPKQELFGGKVTIIRPLAYEREVMMELLAEKLGILSIGQSKCSNDDNSQRIMIKKMLKDFDRKNSAIAKNIFRSLQRVKSEYLLNPSLPEAEVL